MPPFSLRTLVAVLAVASSAAAQTLPEEPAPRAMTLPEAMLYARAHQPSLVAARARIAATRADADVPRAQWQPILGATAQAFAATMSNTTATYVTSGAVDLPRIGATRSVGDGRHWSPSPSTLVAIGGTQELFDFGRIAVQAAAADALVEVQRSQADADTLDLEENVRESFFAVQAARAVVTAADGAFDRSRVHRDFARAGVDQGLRAPIDMTRAEADLMRFDVGRIRARGGLRAAQALFAAAVGTNEVALDAAGEAVSPDDTISLQDAVARATARDPIVREAMARLTAAQEHTKAEAAMGRPDLTLTATLSGRAGGATPSGGDAPSFGGFVPYVPNWDVGVVLTFPLYDATVEARRKAASAHEDAARADIDVVKQRQIAAVQRAHVGLSIARQALPALERARDAAIANAAQADARFKIGLGTSVELADAEALRAASEIEVALGRFEVARARANLGRLIAEGL